MPDSDLQLPLSKRISELTAPGTSSMRVKANEMKEKGVNVINFAAGELYFDASPEIKQGAMNAIQAKGNRYTATLGLPQLRALLAEQASERCNTLYTASEIAVTAGAKQALFNAVLTVLNPGDEVIVPNPGWQTFAAQIQLAQATPVFVNTENDKFKLTFDLVKSALTDRTKMIVINTPNNPTGAVYDKTELLKIVKLAYERDIWILLDECYREIVREPNRHHNIVELYKPIKSQAILVNSFSKSHAVTGWRIGYVCAPKHVISAMSKLQGHTTSNPSSLAQYGALHTIKNESSDYISNLNSFLSRQLNLACTYLDEMPLVCYTRPQGAFYIYINISELLNTYFGDQQIKNVNILCELLLTEAHVAVVSGTSFGDDYGVRMSYGLEENELILGMERLNDFLQGLTHRSR